MADIDYRPRPPFKKSGTVISPRTVTDTLTMYRGITSAPTTTGTLLDFVLETEWTTGSLINADFA